jgi:hypothetical protein
MCGYKKRKKPDKADSMSLNKISRGLLVLLIGLLANPVQAGEWVAMGIRVGTSDPVNGRDKDFTQVGLFGTYSLPWEWQLKGGRPLSTGLNVEFHHLEGPGNSAQLLSIGPQLECRAGKWSLNGGFAVTYLSEPRFTETDLGGDFMMVSHLGARYDFAPSWTAGLRIQHMSNGGIRDPNPGLNVTALELLKRF